METHVLCPLKNLYFHKRVMMSENGVPGLKIHKNNFSFF